MRVFSRLWNSFQWIEKVLLLGCTGALLFFAGSAWSRYRVIESLPPIFEEVSASQTAESGDTNSAIQVHVAGAVKQPGVITLPAASRVSDAIRLAGGAHSDADLETLNLAKKLGDGEKVSVARKGETQRTEMSATAENAGGTVSASKSSSSKKASAHPVNVNKASAAELETLPGIGPVSAERIIEERAEKPFSSISDLGRVKGLGPKKLEKLEPYVTF